MSVRPLVIAYNTAPMLSDTPHGPRPGGFSGDACGNPLRWRLQAVSPPRVLR